MTKKSLCAAIVGLGLCFGGTTQVAFANGFFHHHKNYQQSSYSYAAPVSTQAFTFAAPAVTTQAFTFAAPVAAPQMLTFAAPAVSQTATQYALVPIGASNQAQAQAQGAVAQFGVSDIATIIDLLGRLRGSLGRGGNGGAGGLLNPGGGGIDLGGSRPIEVKVTICGDNSSPTQGGGGSSSGAIENDPLVRRLRELGVLNSAPQGVTPALPSAVQPSGQAASIDAKLDDIVKRLDALTADVEALKKK